MSKTIAVFGGNRSVGRHFIEQALAHGHKIRALIRPNSKSPPLNPHENLTIIIGDAITSPAAVSETLSTASIVFTSIGATTIKSAKKDFISYNAQKVLNEAMVGLPAGQIKRFVIVSSFIVGSSRYDAPWLMRFVIYWFFYNIFEDKEMAERLVYEYGEKSEVEYTIIRPPGLTDNPCTKKYRAGENLQLGKFNWGSISRSDVAHFALETVIEDDQWVNKAVTVIVS